ncbi:MAG: diguanylate cyclase [Sphingomicrobium sp.]
MSADLRNRARLHREIRLSEERYRLLADHSSDILLHLAVDGRIRFVSPSIRQLGGYDPALLVGRNSVTLVAAEHREQVRDAHRATIEAEGRTCTFEYKAQTDSGDLRWFETHSRAIIDDDGTVEGVLSIVRDITDRKAREFQLVSDALTDVLTGLPNRRAFDQLVELRMAEAKTSAGHCLALVDIDHFKRVNDAHGHDGGDAVLRNFAALARRLMRKDDCVARIGGEEFAILLPNTMLDQARQICERLREELSAMTTLFGGADIRVTISGGVARLGDGGPDFALRVADAALYRAKHNGRDQLSIAA